MSQNFFQPLQIRRVFIQIQASARHVTPSEEHLKIELLWSHIKRSCRLRWIKQGEAIWEANPIKDTLKGFEHTHTHAQLRRGRICKYVHIKLLFKRGCLAVVAGDVWQRNCVLKVQPTSNICLADDNLKLFLFPRWNTNHSQGDPDCPKPVWLLWVFSCSFCWTLNNFFFYIKIFSEFSYT